VPQEGRLRRRLQEPDGRFAGTLARRRLTKRSRELRKAEVRRINLPRTPVHRGIRKNGSLTHLDFARGVALLAHQQQQTTPPG
jgi:hypothetical protein